MIVGKDYNFNSLKVGYLRKEGWEWQPHYLFHSYSQKVNRHVGEKDGYNYSYTMDIWRIRSEDTKFKILWISLES
jgi:endo-1,4-beta-D-glucanase Y